MMAVEDVQEVLALLTTAAIPVWIGGGWGVDALAGEQTREHADLDLVIDERDEMATLATFAAAGYVITVDERPARVAMRHPRGQEVDIHPAHFDRYGGATQRLQNGRTFYFFPEGLAGTGRIGPASIRCFSPDLQLACHLGYEPEADDYHDMRLLRDRFGLALPSPYAEADGVPSDSPLT